jgi:hypothetical protein
MPLHLFGLGRWPCAISSRSLHMYNNLHYLICRHALFKIANDQLLCSFDFKNRTKPFILNKYKNKTSSDVNNNYIFNIIFSIQFETNVQYCFPGPWFRKVNTVTDSSSHQK